MLNPYKALLDILPQTPVQLGTVSAVEGGTCLIALEGGGTLWARGSAAVADRVFVRDGVIESTAPSLPLEIVEV